jgi:uncharacterized protein (TIGR03437 family)
VRLSGFPQQARVFVPDRIAGSSAVSATSAGDLGLPPSGGVYQGGGGTGGSLLFSRVQGTDASGAGGFPLAGFIAGFNVLGSISEVPLTGGGASIVYEVLDANGSVNEFAHIPLWIFIPRNSGLDGIVAGAEVSFAPVSTAGEASGNAPIPRFRFAAAPLDCPVTRDCNASYFPELFTDVPNLSATVPNVAGFYQKFIRVRNERGGLMFWTTRITYQDGDGWARLQPDSGVNNVSMNLSFFPEGLSPGIYRATLTIDAGAQAGSRSFPIVLTVIQAPQQPQQPPPDPSPQPSSRPRFWTVGNAADLGVSSLVPGSLARIQGIGLAGNNVRVTFDTTDARIIKAESGELIVVVPPDLAQRPTARLVVVVDSATSEAKDVPLAAAAPAIFPNAVYNQDGFPNAPSNPERITRVLQIFATGLPMSNQGMISAQIHDRVITQPLYGGDAPGSAGVQQVNIPIPGDFPAMTTEVKVCGTPANAPTQPVCSLPATVTIRD